MLQCNEITSVQGVYGVSGVGISTEILNMGCPVVKSEGMKRAMVEASCGISWQSAPLSTALGVRGHGEKSQLNGSFQTERKPNSHLKQFREGRHRLATCHVQVDPTAGLCSRKKECCLE